MLVDMFGNPLATGQHVLYAEDVGGDAPELALYKIVELEAPDIITAELLSGDFIGEWFYLDNPIKRVAVIGGNRALYDAAECYKDSTVN